MFSSLSSSLSDTSGNLTSVKTTLFKTDVIQKTLEGQLQIVLNHYNKIQNSSSPEAESIMSDMKTLEPDVYSQLEKVSSNLSPTISELGKLTEKLG